MHRPCRLVRSFTLADSNVKTLVSDYSGNAYAVSSFTFGTQSDEEVRHKAKVFVSKSRPVKLQFRFFDPPSGITGYSTVQFNVDGAAVPFEQVKVARR